MANKRRPTPNKAGATPADPAPAATGAPDTSPTYHTVIIGAGPIGIEVAAALKRHGVSYLHLDAGQIGHSFTRWTPQTVFFSSPEWIALCGIPIQSADQRQIDGETYLAYLRQVVETSSSTGFVVSR